MVRVSAISIYYFGSFLLGTQDLDPATPLCFFDRAMSVFSLDVKPSNPVTTETVDKLCSKLGVSVEEQEKEDFRRLLAIFHDASEQLMAMEGN